MSRAGVCQFARLVIQDILSAVTKRESPLRSLFEKAKSALLIACVIVLAGCAGGQKVLKEPIPLSHEAPLVSGQDEYLAVSLDWVVVPQGPGTWAKNAQWDQYQLSVQRVIASPVTLSGIRIVDSMNVEHAPLGDRKALIAATKATSKRYEREGFDVQPGAGIDAALSIGTGAAAVGAISGASLSSAALVGLGAGGSAVAAGAAAGAIVVGGPILAVGGIMRASRHGKVNDEIIARASALPAEVPQDEALQLSVFMPITPGPQALEIEYQQGAQTRILMLSLNEVLGRLHLAGPVETDDVVTR